MDNHVPDVLRSDDGRLLATIDPDRGGRLTQLVFDGTPLLIGADHALAHHPLGWGCYPMVPYCGRVRDARLSFGGRSHRLRESAAPHSIHGTTFDRRWDVIDADDSSVRLRVDLGPDWPFLGRVIHHVSVGRGSVSMLLTVEAEEDMPVMVGWHPWFVKPESSPRELRTMLRRDETGIATDERVDRPAGAIDDCFVGRFDGRSNAVDEVLTFRVSNVDLALSSDCTHWVLYDEPSHATCVEPQSGPPNQVNDAPVVLAAGESVTRWFKIRMSTS